MKDNKRTRQRSGNGGRLARTLALCAIAALLAAFAEGRQAGARADLEVLIGHFYCGYDDSDGIVYITFEATGDVNLKNPTLYNNGASFEEDPAGTCNAIRESITNSVRRYGCGVSAVQETQHTDGGASQQLDFVCTGGRDRIVRTLSALVAQYYAIPR
jgi:hypothetical protein